MADTPVWERDGRDWPNRQASCFPTVEGLRWHVQLMGKGPALLLVHGTGAATHSWRTLAPLLAERFEVIAPDLPGHGFTQALHASRLSLNGMADALAGLLAHLEASPALVVGHSAGAAILARMCLDSKVAPRGLVSLNGALLPLRGLPGHIFSPAAKMLAAVPMLPQLFAWRAADPRAVERLVASTGSSLEPAALDLYRRLITSPGHVASTLAMMANWDLVPLERALPRLEQPLFLVVGDEDGTVPPSEALRVRARVPGADLIRLAGLGHLAHEERPELVARLIVRLACSLGVLD
jgi:magnesium chelatase accessory protein